MHWLSCIGYTRLLWPPRCVSSTGMAPSKRDTLVRHYRCHGIRAKRTACQADIDMDLRASWSMASAVIPAAHYVPGDYPTEKFTALVTLTFICVVAPFQVLQTRSQRVAFLIALALVGVLSGAFTFSQGSDAVTDAGLSPDVLLLEGANTISTARILGTGALILIAAALTVRGTHLLHRTAWLTLGVGLVVFMFATGSRGPFSAMVLALAALIVFVPVMREARFRSIVLLSFGSIAAYWWASSQQIVASDRAFAWLTGERDASTLTRINLWKSAADYASVSPLGAGWGGFAHIAKAPSTLKYPHNLFLELYVEAGWIIATICGLSTCVHVETSPSGTRPDLRGPVCAGDLRFHQCHGQRRH